MEKLKKGLIIDGIASTEEVDSDGERLSLEGADISALECGMGRLNDNHSSNFFGSLGRITFAKKIFKKEDAISPREKMYWQIKEKPFLYIQGELYDESEHPNAKACAAVLSHLNSKSCPLSVQASVEGDILERGDKGELKRTKIHSVALTFVPSNTETLIQPITLKKSQSNWEFLIKNIKPNERVKKFLEKEPIERIKEELIEINEELKKYKREMVKCKSCGKVQNILMKQHSCCNCKNPFDFQVMSKVIEKEIT